MADTSYFLTLAPDNGDTIQWRTDFSHSAPVTDTGVFHDPYRILQRRLKRA
jgi:hypothetical protein